MRLIEELSPQCEEFLDLIDCDHCHEELHDTIESLRDYVGQVMDGYVQENNESFAYAVQNRLEEIFNLIPETMKDEDPLIGDTYDVLMCELEKASGFEAQYSSFSDDDQEDNETPDYETFEDEDQL